MSFCLQRLLKFYDTLVPHWYVTVAPTYRWSLAGTLSCLAIICTFYNYFCPKLKLAIPRTRLIYCCSATALFGVLLATNNKISWQLGSILMCACSSNLQMNLSLFLCLPCKQMPICNCACLKLKLAFQCAITNWSCAATALFGVFLEKNQYLTNTILRYHIDESMPLSEYHGKPAGAVQQIH